MIKIFGLIHYCCATNLTAVVVDKDITHYREHPAFEVGVVDILRLVVESLEGGVLQKIVSIIAAAGKHIGEIKKIGLKVHQFALENC